MVVVVGAGGRGEWPLCAAAVENPGGGEAEGTKIAVG